MTQALPLDWSELVKMPTKSSVQRFEAKHNVTTDYPNLGLHSAAANGNIGAS